MASLSSILAAVAILLLLSPIATSSPANSTGEEDPPTAYDLLESFNFPRGLLPQGVKSYSLDRESGKFQATWDGACSFSLEGSYQLKYKPTITGVISPNKLASLTGVSVKVLFLWLNIVEVTRNGDDIGFSVGIAGASFGIENFYECPQCGCGFDCKNGRLRFRPNSIPATNPSS